MFLNFKRFEIINKQRSLNYLVLFALVFLNLASCAKEEGKEIEDVFILSTPSNYDAARRDALKIEKMQKYSIEYKNIENIMKGI